MTTLTQGEMHHLLERFPQIELSYETTPHKKVPPSYNICLGIPVGKKCFVWFSFFGSQNQCFVLELNKDRKIGKVDRSSFNIDPSMFLGTLFYGTFYMPNEEKSTERIFLIEDIFFYKGVPMKGLFFGEKLGFLENFFNEYNATKTQKINNSFMIRLPILWEPLCKKNVDYECIYEIPSNYQKYYPIHHIQYRALHDVVPYLNIFPTKKTIGANNSTKPIDDLILTKPAYKPDFYKQQYKLPTVFVIKADISFDIYRLYAYGASKELIYYGIAYISNYKTSVFMNNIFRKIKENINIDFIEESDDEDDFENVEFDKYVDLKKSALIECKWVPKFKKWLPVKEVDGSRKIVHISQLVSDYQI
jgi:hypothetical protein